MLSLIDASIGNLHHAFLFESSFVLFEIRSQVWIIISKIHSLFIHMAFIHRIKGLSDLLRYICFHCKCLKCFYLKSNPIITIYPNVKYLYWKRPDVFITGFPENFPQSGKGILSFMTFVKAANYCVKVKLRAFPTWYQSSRRWYHMHFMILDFYLLFTPCWRKSMDTLID